MSDFAYSFSSQVSVLTTRLNIRKRLPGFNLINKQNCRKIQRQFYQLPGRVGKSTTWLEDWFYTRSSNVSTSNYAAWVIVVCLLHVQYNFPPRII